MLDAPKEKARAWQAVESFIAIVNYSAALMRFYLNLIMAGALFYGLFLLSRAIIGY